MKLRSFFQLGLSSLALVSILTTGSLAGIQEGPDAVDPLGSISLSPGAFPYVLREFDASGVHSIINMGNNVIKLINFNNPSRIQISIDSGASEPTLTLLGQAGSIIYHVSCHQGGSVSETTVGPGEENTCTGFDRVDIQVDSD